MRDEVFQVSEVVEPYRVAPSIELEENSNFCVFDCRTQHRGGLKNCSWLYFMYHVYKLEGNASVTLSLLSFGHEKRVKCYNGYVINGHVFHTEEHE